MKIAFVKTPIGLAEIQGDERVDIAPRVRGAPLDLIVAELMILANSHWGGWLDNSEINKPSAMLKQTAR